MQMKDPCILVLAQAKSLVCEQEDNSLWLDPSTNRRCVLVSAALVSCVLEACHSLENMGGGCTTLSLASRLYECPWMQADVTSFVRS